MHAITKGSLFFLLIVLSQLSFGASFDCLKAKSVSEILICEDPGLSQKDEELALFYKQAKALVGNESDFRQNNIDAWRWREANCFDRSCLYQWYASRKSYFQNIVKQIDSSQNVLEIKKSKCIKLGLRPGSDDYLECIR
jgi:uncharacterized protein